MFFLTGDAELALFFDKGANNNGKYLASKEYKDMSSFCRKLPPVLESFKPAAKETTCRSGSEVGATEADRSKADKKLERSGTSETTGVDEWKMGRQATPKSQATTPGNETWIHLFSETSQKRDKRSPQPNMPKSLLSRDSTTSSSSKTPRPICFRKRPKQS